MSHPSAPEIHIDEGNEPLVVVLKSPDFSREMGPDGELPYRIDLLRDGGMRLAWTDRHLHSGWRHRLERIEAVTVPFAQLWHSRTALRRARAAMAIFESEGHGLALLRRVTGRRRLPLVIIACWLADLAADGSDGRRRLYRFLYGAVDAVVVFSSNQKETLERLVGIDPARIHVVRFGVDLDELGRTDVGDSGDVVAVGRDLGRDWATLARAAEGTGWQVQLVTRPTQVAGLRLPDEIHLHDRLPRPHYLRLLADARVVVVPTEVREYPTGQTVLLEAMALGKACVVTDTPAMREYVEDGHTALLVPPHDPDALRAAVDRLLSDPPLRERIGSTARAVELDAGGARSMWAQVSEVLATVGVTGPTDPS